MKEPASAQIGLRFKISLVGVEIWRICGVVRIGEVRNEVLVPSAGLKRKELFRGVATSFGVRALSEVDSQKVS